MPSKLMTKLTPMLPASMRRVARAIYVGAFKRRGVPIEINSKRYRVSSSVARGIPRRIDAPALPHWLGLVRGRESAVDAGANIGVWSVLAAAEMPAGARIVAVEPAPASFEILEDCARVSEGPARIIPVRGALGDHVGTTRLVLDSPSAATNRISEDPSQGNTVEVPLLTIDVLLAEHALSPAAIKIDVEGAELLVLRGARQTMRDARPVVVLELHWGRDLGAHPQAILDVAGEYRYTLHDDDGRIVASSDALLRQNFVIMRPA
jgi:FkbM family methyltransferase